MRNYDKIEVLNELGDIENKLDDVTKIIDDARIHSPNIYLVQIQNEIDKANRRIASAKQKFSE